MAIDHIVDRTTQSSEPASLLALQFARIGDPDQPGSGEAQVLVLEAPVKRLVTVPLFLALFLVEAGWLGALVWGFLRLFGAA